MRWRHQSRQKFDSTYLADGWVMFDFQFPVCGERQQLARTCHSSGEHDRPLPLRCSRWKILCFNPVMHTTARYKVCQSSPKLHNTVDFPDTV